MSYGLQLKEQCLSHNHTNAAESAWVQEADVSPDEGVLASMRSSKTKCSLLADGGGWLHHCREWRLKIAAELDLVKTNKCNLIWHANTPNGKRLRSL